MRRGAVWELEATEGMLELTPHTILQLLRIVQEALTNANTASLSISVLLRGHHGPSSSFFPGLATAAAALAFTAIISVGPARANDITLEPRAFVSSLTREQVRAGIRVAPFTTANPDEWTLQQNSPARVKAGRESPEPTPEQLDAGRAEVRRLATTPYGEDSGSSALWKMQAMDPHARVLGGPAR